MKSVSIICFIVFVVSCAQQQVADNKTNAAIDSLEKRVERLEKEKYKPGLGELMAVIQLHHAKLWYAGINNNWKLSAFEVDEIKEIITAAQELETDRPEIKDLPMIFPSIDSITNSIHSKDPVSFKKNFLSLTNTCNACHKANHFEFNSITVPSAAPVSNQDFKVH